MGIERIGGGPVAQQLVTRIAHRLELGRLARLHRCRKEAVAGGLQPAMTVAAVERDPVDPAADGCRNFDAGIGRRACVEKLRQFNEPTAWAWPRRSTFRVLVSTLPTTKCVVASATAAEASQYPPGRPKGNERPSGAGNGESLGWFHPRGRWM